MGKIIGFDDYVKRNHTTVSQLDVGESGYLLPWQCKITPDGFFCVDDTIITP